MPDGMTLRMTRRLPAPREKVFGAFTEIEMLKQWWGPRRFTLSQADFDLRPGGGYRFEMRGEDGYVTTLSGTYREVQPYDRLVYTWMWSVGPSAGIEMLVTIDFRDLGEETEIAITHENLPTAPAQAAHREGWTMVLDLLEKLLREGAGVTSSAARTSPGPG